jgi:hypothetical protein
MNPFEQFLRKLFAGGLPPSVIEEDRQAANMGVAVDKLPKMAKDIGKSFVDSYKQRALDLQTLADQSIFRQVPLSDYEQVQAPRQAQRDLALDVLSAGLGSGMRVGADILSSAPAVGKSVVKNTALNTLRNSPIFKASFEGQLPRLAPDSWKQFGNTVEEARANLSSVLGQIPRNPEIAFASEQIPVGHSSPYFYTQPEISRRTASTGEGAALKGPGLYVGESPAVYDEHYRNTLARPEGIATMLGGQLPIDKYSIKDRYNQVLRDPQFGGIYDNADAETKRKLAMLSDFSYRVPSSSNIESSTSYAESQRNAAERFYKNAELYQKFGDEAKKLLGPNAKDNWVESQTKFMQDYYRRNPSILDEQFNKLKATAEDDVIRYGKYVKSERANYKRALGDFNKAQSQLVKNFKIQQPEKVIATYEGLLGVNPGELLQQDLPFFGLGGKDLERAMQAFGNFKTAKGESLADIYMKNMEAASKNVPKMSPMTLEQWQGDANKDLRNRLRQASTDIQNINVNAIKGYTPSYEYSSLANDPFAIVDALKDQGIVGTKYADAVSRRNFLANITNPEPTTFNYTVFDPRRIQFNRAYGAADPFGSLSSTMQAIQNAKQEKKNGKDSRASKK